MPDTPAPDDIDRALDECEAARAEAAKPLTIHPDATADARERSEAQFRRSLPQIPGGWQTVRRNVLKASSLYGTVGRVLALFHDANATEIMPAQMETARMVIERECKFKIATKKGRPLDKVGARDGLVCGDG